MTDFELAERLNARGLELRESGDVIGAESAYRAAAAAAPTWSAPVYNLGLLCKYEGRWLESFTHNQQATILAVHDEASWWNLGIAATAIGDWVEARRAWTACGIDVPPGEGPPEFNWGLTPIRLEPAGEAEVVWGHRIDPARAKIASVPLPTSPFRWADVVLTDGAEEGQRIANGRTYSVFNVLQLLVRSEFQTFVIELATTQVEALAAFEVCATSRGGAAEDWGTSTNILCAKCSRGVPHEHSGDDSASAHPHWGLAARDNDHANSIISEWLAKTPEAAITVWYEAPSRAANRR